MTSMTDLRERMIADMTSAGLVPSTQERYIQAVRRLAAHYRRSPDQLSERDTGLPRWTAQDRPIENTDVVLWYVFGIHHITRPEDWPVMPCDSVSFWLKPFGFFDRNPALDVPPSGPHGGR